MHELYKLLLCITSFYVAFNINQSGHHHFKATSTLIRFRMPPFLIQRKRIQISASTLAFSTVHTSYEKTIRFRSPWETDYRLSSWRSERFRKPSFSAFSIVHTNTKRIRFRKSPPWKAFSKASVFVGQGWSVFHRISVDDRQKCIQKYAFSNENGLVWTRTKAIHVHTVSFS